MFGIYTFTDRMYNQDPTFPTTKQDNDFVTITPLVDVTTAIDKISKLVPTGGAGGNSAAFDVMYHLIVNSSDSGIDSVSPLTDTYDVKVLYVFTDGIPQYIESTNDDCGITPSYEWGAPCVSFCSEPGKCCEYDSSAGKNSPITSKADHGSAWNPFAECPIDLATLGKVIRDNDWYVAYIGACAMGTRKGCKSYDWAKQVPQMGIESRFTFYSVDYSYAGLSDALVISI